MCSLGERLERNSPAQSFHLSLCLHGVKLVSLFCLDTKRSIMSKVHKCVCIDQTFPREMERLLSVELHPTQGYMFETPNCFYNAASRHPSATLERPLFPPSSSPSVGPCGQPRSVRRHTPAVCCDGGIHGLGAWESNHVLDRNKILSLVQPHLDIKGTSYMYSLLWNCLCCTRGGVAARFQEGKKRPKKHCWNSDFGCVWATTLIWCGLVYGGPTQQPPSQLPFFSHLFHRTHMISGGGVFSNVTAATER